MASKSYRQNVDNQSEDNQTKNKMKGRYIFGITAGAAVIAGAVAASALMAISLASFGFIAIVAAAAVAVGGVLIGLSVKGSQKSKINKDNVVRKTRNQEVQQTEDFERAENAVEAEVVTREAFQQAQPKKAESIIYLPGKVAQSETPRIEDFQTEIVGPNTFAIYNKESKELLKDEFDNERIYNISKSENFRYALSSFAKEFNQFPDCTVVVRDGESNETEHPIAKSTFRNDMTSLYTDIKNVRSQIKEEAEELVQER